MNEQFEKRYVYKTTLRNSYGMTPKMIEELGDADKYVANPNWKTGPYESSLYLIERVEEWVEDNQDRLEKAKASRAIRSAAMKAVHKEKQTQHRKEEKERLRKGKDWADKVEIIVKQPLPKTLLADARRYKDFGRTVYAPDGRKLRNHVRHKYTNYHLLLQEIGQWEVRGEVYEHLRKRLDAIVEEVVVEWEQQHKEGCEQLTEQQISA